MSKTKIQWADETLNPLVGCTKVSAGCAKCYAATAASTPRLQQFDQYKGVAVDDSWTGKINFVPSVLDKLVRMKKPRTIFMPSMSDPFHPDIPEKWLDQMFAAIALTPHVKVMMLTKRAKRMYEYFSRPELHDNLEHARFEHYCQLSYDMVKLPLPNLMLGVSVENQAAANERIPWLLKTPAQYRFLSVEPLLEEVDLIDIGYPHPLLKYWCANCVGNVRDPICSICGQHSRKRKRAIDYVICGGESGPKARPFNLDWARSIAKQCEESGTEFFLKQLGSNPIENGEPLKLRDRKGGDSSEWPEDLREFGERNGN